MKRKTETQKILRIFKSLFKESDLKGFFGAWTPTQVFKVIPKRKEKKNG